MVILKYLSSLDEPPIAYKILNCAEKKKCHNGVHGSLPEFILML